MKTVGIICEYNPFHKGHLYHLQEARKTTQSDYVVAIMSGDFVQRGEPAMMDKYLRTKAALDAGVDLVLELPVSYSLSSAEDFAKGAVMSLNALGSVNSLCFGSETANLSELTKFANFYDNEPEDYKQELKKQLKEGLSFPKARELATERCLGHSFVPQSNDILGISYIRALQQTQSQMTPFVIKREGAGYNEEQLDNQFPSALSIRTEINNSKTANVLASSLPGAVLEQFTSSYNLRWPITADDFSTAVFLLLTQKSVEELVQIKDISLELARRMKRNLHEFTSVTSFAMLIKHKQYTYTRIMRCFMQLVNGITEFQPPTYLRVLGLKKEASCLLNSENRTLPIVQRIAGIEDKLDSNAYCALSQDIASHALYRQVIYNKYQTLMENEYLAPCIYQ